MDSVTDRGGSGGISGGDVHSARPEPALSGEDVAARFRPPVDSLMYSRPFGVRVGATAAPALVFKWTSCVAYGDSAAAPAASTKDVDGAERESGD